MIAATRSVVGATIFAVATITMFTGCNGCNTNNPTTTSVGKSVTTLQKTFSLANCTGTNPPVLPTEPQDWWNAMPAANHQYPFAGWEVFQPGPTAGCATLRLDAYRAVVTFNLASVSNLKGLVQKAELVVATRALPPATGTTLSSGPFGQAGSINLFCPTLQGGAGALVRFGPAAAVPTTSGTGNFEMLGANPFPTGTNVVYTLPSSFHSGAVAGATSATTASPSGNGGSTFTTDVTGAVTAALNANATGMSWMLTSDTEGPLPGGLSTPGDFDCRTSYSFDLRITHF